MIQIIQPRRLRVSAAVATVALVAAGCGSSPRKTTATSAAESPQSVAASAFKYSACMRSHGVSAFPDPRVSSSPGHESVGLRVTPALTSSPAFTAAQKACRSIMPAPSPAEIAQQQHHEEQGKLAFARCMREHGVSGFPDPTVQGRLTLPMVSAAGVDIHAPAVLSAAKACVAVSGGTIPAAAIQQLQAGG